MPKLLWVALVLLVVVSFVPLAYLYLARHTDSETPRIQVVYDMDNQGRYKAQMESPLFADGRAARPPVPGTVPYDAEPVDGAFRDGHIDSVWVERSPVPITREFLETGRQRFEIFCTPCHGLAGHGDGMVHARAAALAEGTWTQPADLTAPTTVARPLGEIVAIIADGVRNMPPGRSLIPARERWAVAAYVRALGRAASGSMDDVPAAARGTLR